MSFYTSLYFYRPQKPPSIVVDDLAKFVSAVAKLNVVDPEGKFKASLKFGEKIDQEVRSVDNVDEDLGGGITSLGEPEWDLETNRFQSLKELSKALGGDRRRVCRGYLRLGYLTDELHTAISRVTPQEDEVDFTPDTFSLHIEPIECVSLSDEQSVRVGWIAAAISGDGYLFPWTLRDAVSKLESRPELKALMELCRTTWPLNNDAPDEATVKVRREIGGLWPYTDFRKPWDWYWGCAES